MTKDPLLFALTGSIGSGKSTAARFFAEEGFVIIDADEISHQITRSPNVLQEIANLFDASLVLPDGSLDRKKLAAQVFADVEKRKELEDLLHPKIREEFFLQLKSIRAKNPKQPVLHVVPLLLEAKLPLDHYAAVIVVAAQKATRIQRIIRRDQCSAQLAEQKDSSQLSQDDKIQRANHVLWNDGNEEELRQKVQDLADQLKQ